MRIEASNFRLDSYDPAKPVLVVEDPRQPAYLTFNFPPQTIVEWAYFEATTVRLSLDPAQPKGLEPETGPGRPDPEAARTTTQSLDPPGH